MVAESPHSRQARRLHAVDKAYRTSHKAIHDDFNKVFDALMQKHGLQINSLMDYFSFPPEFHEDLAEAKAAFMAGHTLAQDARQSSVSALPRRH